MARENRGRKERKIKGRQLVGVKGFPFFSGGGRGEGEREVKESGGTNEGKEWGDTKESPPPPLCSPLIQLGAACFPDCRRRRCCCPLIGGLSPLPSFLLQREMVFLCPSLFSLSLVVLVSWSVLLVDGTGPKTRLGRLTLFGGARGRPPDARWTASAAPGREIYDRAISAQGGGGQKEIRCVLSLSFSLSLRHCVRSRFSIEHTVFLPRLNFGISRSP